MNRAPFCPEWKSLRSQLPDLLGILEAETGWYGSVFLERKRNQTFSANLKNTQVADQLSEGAVLRIYDGCTLYEEASDRWDFDALKTSAQALVKRVRGDQAGKAGLKKRPYAPPTWAQRLAMPLEDEIRSQIPRGVTAQTPVHFGISFAKDPTAFTVEQHLGELKGMLERMRALGAQVGFAETELSYLLSRRNLSVEESLFVDRESNLSQTLYRVAMTIMMMSGAERTYHRTGGLGGMEALEISDALLLDCLRDLKGIKQAERLTPGRYRLLFSPGLSGVLAHEAFGHSQEGDTCARGRSKAWELHQSGEKVGNQNATILNNPAIFSNATEPCAAWGSYYFDEEGWLAQEQVLLDQGKLKSPMTNLTSALRLGVNRSANGKRESWQSGVYTRQTNTYFSAGIETFDQLLSKIDHGFVALNAAGGMEDPKGMGIQVGIQFLKEVKNGKLTGRYFKGPAGGDIQLTGYVPDVLNSIIGKSKIEADRSTPDQARFPLNDAGGCGKYHKEIVYAGCGGPYLLLDQVILG